MAYERAGSVFDEDSARTLGVLKVNGWGKGLYVKNTHTPSLLRARGKVDTPTGKGMFRENVKYGRNKIQYKDFKLTFTPNIKLTKRHRPQNKTHSM